jgi:hypothetical protein
MVINQKEIRGVKSMEFKENEKITFDSNFYVLRNKARVGDTLKFQDGDVWKRVDKRKNNGDAWILL